MATLGSADNLGVGSWIERRARSMPDATALLVGDTPVSYATLAERVRRLANGLRQLGVAKGDRVAWVGPNHPAFLETLFAAGWLGAVLAPINHHEPNLVEAIITEIEPTVLVQHSASDRTPATASVTSQIAVAGAVPGTIEFEHLSDAASIPEEQVASVALDDLCLLPHTSGTTGRQKVIKLTHGNMTWNAVNMAVTAGISRSDTTIAIAPLFRTGGLGVNVLPVLFMGGTVVLPHEQTPEEILRLMDLHQVTVGFGNPDFLAAMARSPLWEEVDLTSLRFIIAGGAAVPARLIRTYRDRGVELLQGYGLSEAGPACLLLQPHDSLRKIGSAGKPILQVDARLVDASGSDVARGEVGELLVRGPNVMAGYWRQPEATRKAFTTDGWLRTGDAARQDHEGYLYILDRFADRFETGGRTIFPHDVEDVLLSHEAVAEAAVVGVPDEHLGRVGAAFVVLAPQARVDKNELLERCRQRLDPWQVPASVTFLAQIPRSSVGKPLRDKLVLMSPDDER